MGSVSVWCLRHASVITEMTPVPLSVGILELSPDDLAVEDRGDRKDVLDL